MIADDNHEPICCLKSQFRKLLVIAGGNLIWAPFAWLLSGLVGQDAWKFWVECAGFLAFMSIFIFVRIRSAERALRKHMERPMRSEMDEECCDLVNALNECPGIHTMGSCSGHGIDSFFVTMHAESREALLPVIWSLFDCGVPMDTPNKERWRLIATVSGDGETDWWYCLEGPDRDVERADRIAEKIRQILRDGVHSHIRRRREYWSYRAKHPEVWELKGAVR